MPPHEAGHGTDDEALQAKVLTWMRLAALPSTWRGGIFIQLITPANTSAQSRWGQPLSSGVAISLSQQLWQPRHVDGNPARLVFRENFRLPCFVFVVARIDVNKRLPVSVRTT
jgi:hypothetical protein